MVARYKHILWDWNGTLLDDRQLALSVVNSILVKRGLSPISVSTYLQLFTHPVMDFYREIGLGPGVMTVQEIASEFVSGYESGCHTCHLQLGAKQALQSFQHAGLKQSILSASHAQALKRFVMQFGVGEYFDALIGLDDHYAHSKLEQGMRWLKNQPFHPGDVLLVGDTDHDSEVALHLGCDCVLVSRGHQSAEKLATCQVPVMSSLVELTHLLTS